MSNEATDFVGAILNKMDQTISNKSSERDINVNKEGNKSMSVDQSRRGKSNKAEGANNSSRSMTGTKTNNGGSSSEVPRETKDKNNAPKRYRPHGSHAKEKEQKSSSDEMKSLREDLKTMQEMMSKMLPVVSELKSAHDSWIENEANYVGDEEEGHMSDNTENSRKRGSENDNGKQVSKKQKNDDHDLLELELQQPSTSYAPTEEANNSSSYIDELSKEVDDDEQCGPPINDKLAKILTNIAKKGINGTKEKERLKDTAKPENCPLMGKIRITMRCG